MPVAELQACRLAHHHRIGLRQTLQPRGEVRRLTHRSDGLGIAGAGQITGDDQTGGNANTHRKPLRAYRLNDRQGCAHRALGMGLVWVRPAEIGQHTVANEAGDIALLANHCGGYAGLIRGQDLTQLFRIKSSGERG